MRATTMAMAGAVTNKICRKNPRCKAYQASDQEHANDHSQVMNNCSFWTVLHHAYAAACVMVVPSLQFAGDPSAYPSG
jgi:anti-sigma-K factor RskA